VKATATRALHLFVGKNIADHDLHEQA